MNIVLFCILLCLFIYFGFCSISGELCIEYTNCSSCNYSFLENKKDRWLRWHCDLEFKVAAVIQWLNKTKDCYDANSEFFHTNVSIDFDDHSFNMSCKVPGEYPLHATWEKGFTCVINSDNLSLKSEPVIKLACMENHESPEERSEAHNFQFISLLVVPVLIIAVAAIAYRRRKQQLKLSNLQQRASNNTYEEFPENLPEQLTDKESIQGIKNEITGVESEHKDLKLEACGDIEKSLTASVDEMTDDRKSADNVCMDLISADQLCDDYDTIENVSSNSMPRNTLSVGMTAGEMSANITCDDSMFADNLAADYATIDKISAKEKPTNTVSVEIPTTGRMSAEKMEVEITAEKNYYGDFKSRPSTKTNSYSYVGRNFSSEVENRPENGEKERENDDVDVYDVLKLKS